MKKSTASFSYVYILTILTDYQKQRTAARGGKDPHAGVMVFPHTSLTTHLLPASELALQHQIISPGASIERRRQLTRRTTAIGECLHFLFFSSTLTLPDCCTGWTPPSASKGASLMLKLGVQGAPPQILFAPCANVQPGNKKPELLGGNMQLHTYQHLTQS
jgi:hypothetical protein